MTAKDYFGYYWNYIDKQELNKIMVQLKRLYSTKSVCPAFKNVFKAFKVCPFKELKVIILGQDPYPQKDVATGVAFANKKGTSVLSPSLEVLKKAVSGDFYYQNFITFAPDLEEWGKQGVLLLNSALTVETNKIGSHTLLWRPFISKFLSSISKDNPGLVYVLFGNQAQTFKSYIHNGHIVEEKHPSYYVRTNTDMPISTFQKVNELLKQYWDSKINWFNK